MIPRLGRSPEEGNGNSLQNPCLENPMGRGAWQVTVHGVTRVGYSLVTPTTSTQKMYSFIRHHKMQIKVMMISYFTCTMMGRVRKLGNNECW